MRRNREKTDNPIRMAILLGWLTLIAMLIIASVQNDKNLEGDTNVKCTCER